MKKWLLGFCLGLLPGLACAGFSPSPSHGGSLVEIGDEAAYVELVLDKEAGKLKAYVMDGEAEDPVRLAQKSLWLKVRAQGRRLRLKLEALADPLSGERSGDSSVFEADLKLLAGIESFHGELEQMEVLGQVFEKTTFEFPRQEALHGKPATQAN
jgi:hypothetical protein